MRSCLRCAVVTIGVKSRRNRISSEAEFGIWNKLGFGIRKKNISFKAGSRGNWKEVVFLLPDQRKALQGCKDAAVFKEHGWSHIDCPC